MPMKKIHVEFELDPEIFMKMLQHGSSSMKIAVFGDDRPLKQREQKLLPAPKPLRVVALDFFRERKDRAVPIRELREYCLVNGFRPNSAYQIVSLLIENKHLKKVDVGMYQITPAGVNYVN